MAPMVQEITLFNHTPTAGDIKLLLVVKGSFQVFEYFSCDVAFEFIVIARRSSLRLISLQPNRPLASSGHCDLAPYFL